MSRAGLVLREGLLFGAIAGVFTLVVRLVTLLATNRDTPTPLSSVVAPALILLIVGGAARKMAMATRATGPAFQMGALAGGVSELIGNVLGGILISYLPVGRAAYAHLSPAARRVASDPGMLIASLGVQLGLAILFGAMIGWIAAWARLRFGPPGEPPLK